MSPQAPTTDRPFTNGVYCPLITPFTRGSEGVDHDALARQVVRIARTGMGLVLLGTNGEASHLSEAERTAIIRTARHALSSASPSLAHVPILAGTGVGSVHETLRLCREAADAGADRVIVVPPGYFASVLGSDRDALKAFFWEVLDASPVPVMIYNFPGAAAGIDLDSDILIELAEHQNCFGAKLTCAGIGKGHRLAAHTQSAAYRERHPQPFFVLPGFSDVLLPAMVCRASGCITGTGNVIPKTIVKLYNTIVRALESGDPADMKTAQELQDIVADADWAIVKSGIGGTKWAINKYIEDGLGGVPRKPLPEAGAGVQGMLDGALERALAYEASI